MKENGIYILCDEKGILEITCYGIKELAGYLNRTKQSVKKTLNRIKDNDYKTIKGAGRIFGLITEDDIGRIFTKDGELLRCYI